MSGQSRPPGRGRPRLPRLADTEATESQPQGSPTAKSRGMERLADLLPQTVRQFGLEDQFEQAGAAAAWLRVIEKRVPEAAGSCRLSSLGHGIATIETDSAIVAQEIRLRTPELLAALRASIPTPIRQIRVTIRHV